MFQSMGALPFETRYSFALEKHFDLARRGGGVAGWGVVG